MYTYIHSTLILGKNLTRTSQSKFKRRKRKGATVWDTDWKRWLSVTLTITLVMATVWDTDWKRWFSVTLIITLEKTTVWDTDWKRWLSVTLTITLVMTTVWDTAWKRCLCVTYNHFSNDNSLRLWLEMMAQRHSYNHLTIWDTDWKRWLSVTLIITLVITTVILSRLIDSNPEW